MTVMRSSIARRVGRKRRFICAYWHRVHQYDGASVLASRRAAWLDERLARTLAPPSISMVSSLGSEYHEVVAVDDFGSGQFAGAQFLRAEAGDAARELGAVQIAHAHDVAGGERPFR